VDVLAPPDEWRTREAKQTAAPTESIDATPSRLVQAFSAERKVRATHGVRWCGTSHLLGSPVGRIVRPKSERCTLHRLIADTFRRPRLSARIICERLEMPVAHGSSAFAASRIEGQRKKIARDCGSFAQFSGGVLPFLDHSTKIKTNKAHEGHRHAVSTQKEKSPQSHTARSGHVSFYARFSRRIARFLRVPDRNARQSLSAHGSKRMGVIRVSRASTRVLDGI
jgi:hypothetical protein